MTDEDIFEILRKQEEALSNKNSFYFHYDPSTARIINFRNYLEQDDTFPFIKINEEDLEFSIDELFDILDYRVVEKNKKLVIEKSKLEEISLISNIIYQVPKIYSQTNDINDEYDLLIEQDNEHKEFIIKTVFTSFDLYKCSNVKPDVGSHGIPIFLEIYVTREYITNCLEEK